jgi:hypothetical protein
MYTLSIWLWSNIFDFVSKLHNNYIIQLLYEWPICAISCATNYTKWHVWSSHMSTFLASIWNDTFNFYMIYFQLNLPLIQQLLLGFHYVNTTNPPIWDFHSTSIWLIINYVATNTLWYHLQIVWLIESENVIPKMVQIMYTLYYQLHWDVHKYSFVNLKYFIINIKENFTLHFSTLKTKEQHRRSTKHVFFLNDLLFLNIIFSLFLVHFQWSKMQWKHQINIYMNHLSSRDKGTTKITMKKMNVMNLKMWIRLMTKH